ncbi:hypothetical protein D3C79_250690 [compost metagenome]
MAKGKDQHVTPHPDGWQVIGEGNSLATVVTATKQEAINAGREIARKQESELVIHNRDGKIANSDSHGHDPNPPKDTK